MSRVRPTRVRLTRRRLVAALSLAAGAVLLGVALSRPPGESTFYPLTVALALVWVIGAWASGPIPIVGAQPLSLRRLAQPVLIGAGLAAVFLLGALAVRQIPGLRDITADVLEHARELSLPVLIAITVANGLAEEAFFRGALYDAVTPTRLRTAANARALDAAPVAISTVIYAVVVAATGNVMLMFAAAVLGAICALQRGATGGVLAGMLTHITWSVAMLLALPPLFPNR